jgi:hypothetical protein
MPHPAKKMTSHLHLTRQHHQMSHLADVKFIVVRQNAFRKDETSPRVLLMPMRMNVW